MIQEKYRNVKISTWLLPVVLVLSLLTFSGVNGPSGTKQSVTRTEQIDAHRVSNKRCASFKIICVETIRSSAQSFQQVLFKHSFVVKEQEWQCTKHCLEFIVFNPSITHFTPRSAVEGSFISQIG